jgi:hypothetical protein
VLRQIWVQKKIYLSCTRKSRARFRPLASEDKEASSSSSRDAKSASRADRESSVQIRFQKGPKVSRLKTFIFWIFFLNPLKEEWVLKKKKKKKKDDVRALGDTDESPRCFWKFERIAKTLFFFFFFSRPKSFRSRCILRAFDKVSNREREKNYPDEFVFFFFFFLFFEQERIEQQQQKEEHRSRFFDEANAHGQNSLQIKRGVHER